MEKDKLLSLVEKLPQEIDLEQFIESIILVNKIEKGLKQIKEGKTLSHNQVNEIVKQW